MTTETINAALRQIKALAERALKDSSKPARQATDVSANPVQASTLPEHIMGLKREGFFKQGKTAKEVHAKLQSSYSCDLDRVFMALLRLQRKKLLRKTSKLVGKKKQV